MHNSDYRLRQILQVSGMAQALSVWKKCRTMARDSNRNVRAAFCISMNGSERRCLTTSLLKRTPGDETTTNSLLGRYGILRGTENGFFRAAGFHGAPAAFMLL